VPEPGKYINLNETDVCGEIIATLSEISVADMDLVITWQIKNGAGVIQCFDTDTFTIPSGSIAYEFMLDFDCSIPVGGCYHLETEDYSDPEGMGWTVPNIVRNTFLSNCLCAGD
jgi:hypothetical protein